jgi:MYXO-CTERM domain-containing protein
VLQVLRVQIPLTATLASQGITEANFYANMEYYWGSFKADFAPFDPVAATTAMDTDVLSPLDSYQTLFARTGRLTRLATFISPEEMTKDPLFVPNPSLPDMAPQHLAIAHVMCGNGASACAAPVRLQTEDGQDVNFRPTTCMQYARGDLDLLPASTVAWQRDPDTEGTLVVDNRPQIAAALQVHNAAIIMPTTGSGGSTPGGGLRGSGGGSGCGCTTAGPPGLVLWLTVAGGLALSRRRRRR